MCIKADSWRLPLKKVLISLQDIWFSVSFGWMVGWTSVGISQILASQAKKHFYSQWKTSSFTAPAVYCLLYTSMLGAWITSEIIRLLPINALIILFTCVYSSETNWVHMPQSYDADFRWCWRLLETKAHKKPKLTWAPPTMLSDVCRTVDRSGFVSSCALQHAWRDLDEHSVSL